MYILQTENLTKKYKDITAVNKVNLNINKGEIYGLLGPNGAGKSTLIRMISGLEKITEGKIIYNEKIEKIDKYKKNIGLLPQELAIYMDFTAKENVLFFCSLYGFKGKELKKRVDKALEFVALTEYQNKKACEFSGGMKRRLNMACAIAHTPNLIIMDEPTVGIDPQSRNHILQSVKMLKSQGATIIYTSHYMEEIEALCDNIAIMDKGSIIAKGNKEDLKLRFISNNIYTIRLKNNIENIDIIIKKIPGVKNVEVKDNEVKCYYSKNSSILQKLINTIYNHSGIIESIKTEVPSLEKVFLNLTGKKLRD